MTDTPDAELAPCPNCGGEAWIDYLDIDNGYSEFSYGWMILCDDGCTEDPQMYDTRAEAVAAWNAAAKEHTAT